MAEEEEEPLKADTLLYPNTFISWERIHLPSFPTTQSPVISLPDPHSDETQTRWSTPPDHKHHYHTPVVFPPTNHEGLNLQTYVPETTHVETVKPLTTDSTSSEMKPVVIGGPISVKWWVLRVKWFGILSWVWNWVFNRKGLVWFMNLPIIGSTVVMGLFYLRFCLRRRRRSRGEAVDELLGVIKEKDERINQLLHQIARMNELLLASHHGVPMISKATTT
ncbi:hypothetical protein M8C21_016631 [Ambrosia artemisiifolia]|uniref:Transmembrane protein n=1 Tax=Ambrosia artemisiifolia TaxID=4212 RepID=A0AAD5GJJ5_AMBAR|nr:hypothetical protein M8C21_016631 [Ambrosia artemisiifolia]